MNIQSFRELFNAQPFKPFTLHLADGREILVPHRDFLYIPPAGREIIVYQTTESLDIVDTLLVTDVEFKLNPNAAPGDNTNGNKQVS